MTMDLHKEMASAAAEDARVVAGAEGHELTGATPCTDWDLHTLLNHAILWTAYSAERRARDEPLPDGLTETDFVAQPGWAQAYAAQLDQAVAAWSDPGAWTRELNMMGSPTPSDGVGALLLAEMVLHGWDVARSVRVRPAAGGVGAGPGLEAQLARVADRVHDGPQPGPVGQVLQQHGPAVAVGQRDPPVRVLIGGARNVLRLPLAHGVRQGHP